jgi:rhamnogalacturonyl hydrolase YesR
MGVLQAVWLFVRGLTANRAALMALWRATKDPKLLELAQCGANEKIEKRTLYRRNMHIHADHFAAGRGLFELYLATGQQKYLDEVMKVYDLHLNKDMWVAAQSDNEIHPL